MKVILIVLFINSFIAINKGDAQFGGENNARIFPSRSEAEQESDKIFEDPIENKMPKEQSDYHSNHKDQSNGRYNDNYDDDYNEEKPVNSVVSSWSGTYNLEFKYKCGTVNGKYCPVERLLLKVSHPMPNIDCTQRICGAGFIEEYIAFDQDGKKHKMTVDYLDQTLYPTTIVLKEGAKTHYDIGTVTGGPCKGATVQVTDYSPNPYPDACKKKSGVTRLESAFAELSIIGCGKENIACFGSGYQTFTPGLMSSH